MCLKNGICKLRIILDCHNHSRICKFLLKVATNFRDKSVFNGLSASLTRYSGVWLKMEKRTMAVDEGKDIIVCFYCMNSSSELLIDMC